MREICRGLRFPEGPVAMPDGSVLLVEIERGTLSRVTPEGASTRTPCVANEVPRNAAELGIGTVWVPSANGKDTGRGARPTRASPPSSGNCPGRGAMTTVVSVVVGLRAMFVIQFVPSTGLVVQM